MAASESFPEGGSGSSGIWLYPNLKIVSTVDETKAISLNDAVITDWAVRS